MVILPNADLMNEQRCYNWLLSVLHPNGLSCPHGHRLPPYQKPHDRHRAPMMDYRCRQCGAVFNLFTNTIWSKTRYSCRQILLILRGIARGLPTKRLAEELAIDRSHLSKRRREIQRLIQRHFSPAQPSAKRLLI